MLHEIPGNPAQYGQSTLNKIENTFNEVAYLADSVA